MTLTCFPFLFFLFDKSVVKIEARVAMIDTVVATIEIMVSMPVADSIYHLSPLDILLRPPPPCATKRLFIAPKKYSHSSKNCIHNLEMPNGRGISPARWYLLVVNTSSKKEVVLTEQECAAVVKGWSCMIGHEDVFVDMELQIIYFCGCYDSIGYLKSESSVGKSSVSNQPALLKLYSTENR